MVIVVFWLHKIRIKNIYIRLYLAFVFNSWVAPITMTWTWNNHELNDWEPTQMFFQFVFWSMWDNCDYHYFQEICLVCTHRKKKAFHFLPIIQWNSLSHLMFSSCGILFCGERKVFVMYNKEKWTQRHYELKIFDWSVHPCFYPPSITRMQT